MIGFFQYGFVSYVTLFPSIMVLEGGYTRTFQLVTSKRFHLTG